MWQYRCWLPHTNQSTIWCITVFISTKLPSDVIILVKMTSFFTWRHKTAKPRPKMSWYVKKFHGFVIYAKFRLRITPARIFDPDCPNPNKRGLAVASCLLLSMHFAWHFLPISTKSDRFAAIDSLLTVPSPGTIFDRIVRAVYLVSVNSPRSTLGAWGAPFKPPDNMFFRYEAPRDPLWDF